MGERATSKPIFSILVPVCNEERVIPLFFERMFPVIQQLATEFEPHLIFLNNSSDDRTLESILALRQEYPQVFVITLASRVRVMSSLEFGLKQCVGDYYVFIDVDLEDPPEMILDFVRKHKEGYDVVYGERVDRSEAWIVKSLRKVFYRVMRGLADDVIVLDMAEFSLMTAEVRNAIVQDSSSYPFIRASIGRVGFKRVGIPYRRSPRVLGKTHYNAWGLVTFAVGGILASSTLMLRMPAYVFPFWLLVMALLTVRGFMNGAASALTAIVFLGFVFCGGVLTFVSIYLARVYRNTLGRPGAFMSSKDSILQGAQRVGGSVIAERHKAYNRETAHPFG